MAPRAWRENQELTQGQMASRLSEIAGIKVANYQVCRIEAGALPSKEICHAYHKLTEGAVSAGDFYQIEDAA
jgi:hypothetical protein